MKRQLTKVFYHSLKSATRMYPSWKSLFCCGSGFNFRRIWNSLMDGQSQSNYNRDVFYANNSPTGPIIVYG